MRVELVQATPNPVKLIADIASICYGKDEAAYPEKLVKKLFELDHTSTFEHVYFTFKIEGISRACLAQLTRHRHASYTVRSQRYCDETETEFVYPISEDKHKYKHELFQTVYEFALQEYQHLIELGVKKEDARFVLPEATTTELYMSMNLRELLHIYELRSSKAAQWEISDLINLIKDIVIGYEPSLEVFFV